MKALRFGNSLVNGLRTLTCLVGLFGAVSCQNFIFEDRTDCPSFIFVKAEPEIDPKTWEYLDIEVWEDGRKLDSRDATVYELNRGFYLEANKNKYFEATLLGGWPKDWMADGYLLIPEGNECPDGVGAYFGLEIGTEEKYEMPLTLTNLYVNVFFEIKGAASEYPIDITVSGVVDGYKYPGSGVHYGPFHAGTRTNSYRERAVRIPRQLPFQDIARSWASKASYSFEDPKEALDYLVADIFVENANVGQMSHYLTLPLGKIIAGQEYDWLAAAPEDVHVEITMFDDSIASLKVSTRNWTVVYIGDNGKYVI